MPTETPIVVHYSSIDRAHITRRFKTLAGAQRFAVKWVGETPELGSGYAVSPDGIGKIEVSGCMLHQLFPTLANDLPQLARDAASEFMRSRAGATTTLTVFERDSYVVKLAKQHGYDDADVHWFWEVFTDYLTDGSPVPSRGVT